MRTNPEGVSPFLLSNYLPVLAAFPAWTEESLLGQPLSSIRKMPPRRAGELDSCGYGWEELVGVIESWLLRAQPGAALGSVAIGRGDARPAEGPTDPFDWD